MGEIPKTYTVGGDLELCDSAGMLFGALGGSFFLSTLHLWHLELRFLSANFTNTITHYNLNRHCGAGRHKEEEKINRDNIVRRRHCRRRSSTMCVGSEKKCATRRGLIEVIIVESVWRKSHHHVKSAAVRCGGITLPIVMHALNCRGDPSRSLSCL